MKNNHERFCTLVQAQKLKSIGFPQVHDEMTRSYYTTRIPDGVDPDSPEYAPYRIHRDRKDKNESDAYASYRFKNLGLLFAPTLFDVFDWFQDKKDILIIVDIKQNKFSYQIQKLTETGFQFMYNSESLFDDYYDAMEAGIDTLLDEFLNLNKRNYGL